MHYRAKHKLRLCAFVVNLPALQCSTAQEHIHPPLDRVHVSILSSLPPLLPLRARTAHIRWAAGLKVIIGS